MPIGAFTASFDLPLLLVILFVLFFLGLVYHLHQEDKREGYPLVSNRTRRSGGRVTVVGFPPLPKPKTFLQPHGRPPVTVPRIEEPEVIDAEGAGVDDGLPLVPRGDPMGAGIGPGSWSMKVDEPDLSHDGDPVFVPLREAAADGFRVVKGDPDPRGYAVLGLDKRVAGRVVDIWIDRSEHYAKFLEVELDGGVLSPAARRDRPGAREERVVGVVVVDEIVDTTAGPIEITEVDVVTALIDSDRQGPGDAGGGVGTVLLPMEFAAVNGSARTVRTAAITAAQFGGVPRRKQDLILTAREENQLRGYYGGGYLYAVPGRTEPLI